VDYGRAMVKEFFFCLLILSSATAWWKPTKGTTWEWQLSNCAKVNMTYKVQMYDLDLFDTPQATINTLHSMNVTVICYVDVGTWENWRPDADEFPDSVKGRDNGWPGEKWLDIRQTDILMPIMEDRFDLAVSMKCDGIEPDNVDGYSNPTGFPLTANDQLTYNKLIYAAAHARNMSVGLKNDGDQVKDLIDYVDWALDEQCFQYNECNVFQPFLDRNMAVFECEYDLPPSAFCSRANAMGLSSIYSDLDLTGTRTVECWNQ